MPLRKLAFPLSFRIEIGGRGDEGSKSEVEVERLMISCAATTLVNLVMRGLLPERGDGDGFQALAE